MNDDRSHAAPSGNSLIEIFWVFLKLGCTSFGGPTAHIGYFNREFVKNRRWIDEAGFVDLLTLCQFLPGPTSSQIGFSLGVLRGGGVVGGLIAWLAFTLPSALLMVAAAYGATIYSGVTADRVIHGLKLVAVAVVANAVWTMAKGLRKERARIAIAFTAIPILFLFGTSLGQIITIGCGALLGVRFCKDMMLSASGALQFPISRRRGMAALGLFLFLFFSPLLLGSLIDGEVIAIFESFFHAGALVFGGGHVVLPLLQNELVPNGWITDEVFLAGYGFAQAIPGPLFTIAAYLGAVMTSDLHGMAGAIFALMAIFLPGLLLVYGMLPFWDALRERNEAQAAMRGVTASVVGLLAVAFYNNVLMVTVSTWIDVVVALAGFALLTFWKTPSWVVVVGVACAGAVLAGT